MQSVTEESSFQEFLSTAELAGTEFQAEKLNIKFVNSKSGVLSKAERDKILKTQEENRNLLKIPRRPKWDSSTTPQDLQCLEKEAFLQWRRSLSELQETEGVMLTPFEKNLEFWRQLWRVVERSDVVVQIVDARNPLLFRCEDLEHYVKEVDCNKLNMILINKADFLTHEQRIAWTKYFTDMKVQVAFFSALLSQQKIEEENEDEANTEDKNEDEEEDETDDESVCNNNCNSENEEEGNVTICFERETNKKVVNSSKLLNRDSLIQLLKTMCGRDRNMDTTIGLVGYPNVGKSSTINALLRNKKVSVSATPGKTKHFQTFYLDTHLLLCDCPGLVMPSFVCTKADMILNGILSIDQMRDHVAPVTLLTTLIPRHVLEDLYSLLLPVSQEAGNADRPLTTEELLNAHGCT